jgi:hypothetical protein
MRVGMSERFARSYQFKVAKPSNAALDYAAVARLWDVSSEPTGLS